MSDPNFPKKNAFLPILLIGGVLMVLGMLRLGVWQLDRAAEKQVILDQVIERAAQAPIPIDKLVKETPVSRWLDEARFRKVTVTGRFLADNSILIDNQVLNQQGGYRVVTPFEIDSAEAGGSEPIWVLISRGWIAAGATRADLPIYSTPKGELTLNGRLNKPYAQPPLWKEGYPVSDGMVWQYLPIAEYAAQMQASVLPLMIELAPGQAGINDLKVNWQDIDDSWVAKHKGYAFQWFAMAATFFIACLVLLLRRGARGAK